jgi:hypothetical protein
MPAQEALADNRSATSATSGGWRPQGDLTVSGRCTDTPLGPRDQGSARRPPHAMGALRGGDVNAAQVRLMVFTWCPAHSGYLEWSSSHNHR